MEFIREKNKLSLSSKLQFNRQLKVFKRSNREGEFRHPDPHLDQNLKFPRILRTICVEYLIQKLEMTGRSGLIASFDLAKAFDTIDHKYLYNTLKYYNFPPQLINMIKTLYNGAESAVLNNGLTTKYFKI